MPTSDSTVVPSDSPLCARFVPLFLLLVLGFVVVAPMSAATAEDVEEVLPQAKRIGAPVLRPSTGLELRPAFGAVPWLRHDTRGMESPKAPPEVLFIFGEPGSNEGTFEDLSGQPDWQGWTSHDNTETSSAENHWHVFDAGAVTAMQELTPGGGINTFAKAVAVIDSLAGDDRKTIAVGGVYFAPGSGNVSVYFGSDIAADATSWTLAQTNVHFGDAIADMGDIDGDGDHEILVGSPTSGDPALAYAFFGEAGVGLADTTPGLVFSPFFADASFGDVVAGIGDFNGDGFDDWAIDGSSILYVYFGAAVPDANPDLFLQLSDFNGWGYSITGGDVTGDGYSDLLVGEPGAIVNGGTTFFVGSVHVYEGSAVPDLVSDHVLMGDVEDGAFGASIAVLPPMDGGPAQDLVIGAPYVSQQRGRVYVYDQVVPENLYDTYDGSQEGARYGVSLAAMPELVEPGHTAFAVGEPMGGGALEYGRAYVLEVGPQAQSWYAQGTIPFDEFGQSVGDASGSLGPGFRVAIGAPSSGGSNGRVVLAGLGRQFMAYCGEESPPPEWVEGPGYGDGWNDVLDWYADAPDPGQPMELCLSFRIRVEVEDQHDYVYVEYETAGGFIELDRFTGNTGWLSPTYCAIYDPSDYVANPITGNPGVHLSIRVDTDWIMSDESGGFDTELGAALVDDLTVTFDGSPVSSASFDVDGSDDSPFGLGFTDHDSGGWLRSSILCGDFAQLISDFQDIDPLRTNLTPQVAFIDDGTPPHNDPFGRSTGGSLGSTTYGVPGAWVVNYTGGVSGGSLDLHNEVRSPEIPWDDPTVTTDDDYDHAVVSFDGWMELPSENGIFYDLSIRYFPDASGTSWSPWDSDTFVYRSVGDASYETRQHSIGDLVVPEAEKIQVSLVVWDLARYFGVPGNDATPSPTFDNIRVFKQFNSTVSAPTPVGVGVPVDLDEVQLDFGQVTQEGVTTVVREVTFGDPSNFYLATDPRIMHLITTTAEYDPPITVCITYDEADLQIPEEDMQLIHLESSGWEDITISHDLVNDTICGLAWSLSPFGLAREISPTDVPPERTPQLTRLHPPAPNPFNPRTVIRYELARDEFIELDIYDVRGRLVRRLESGHRAAGPHETYWNGQDDRGKAVASGAYLLQLKTSSKSLEQRMTLVR